MHSNLWQDLQANFSGEIREGELIKFHTGFKMGGPAQLLAIPKGMDDLRRAVVWAGKNRVAYRVIGNGLSVLAGPAGYDGMVIKLGHVLNHIRIENNLIYAGAGAVMSVLLRQALNHQLQGLETWSSASTVGGWLILMAKAEAAELDHLVKEVYVMEPDGAITRWIEPSQLFSKGRAEETGRIVVEVVFQLQSGDRQAIAGKIMQQEQEQDFLTQTNLPLAGPAFLPEERDFTRLFVEAGVSGLRRGQAAFLGVGNGFVANLGRPEYTDVRELINEVREKVFQVTGRNLQGGLSKL